MRGRFAIAALLLCLSSCAYIPVAGGALTGTETNAPTDWQPLNTVDIIQLETQPEAPYSVKLWMIAETTHLYVYAGDKHAQWVKNIEADARVRVKIRDAVYSLHAQRVTDEAEFQRFATAWLAKYHSNRSRSSAADSYLFRLSSRK